jgi:hypothetical protein
VTCNFAFEARSAAEATTLRSKSLQDARTDPVAENDSSTPYAISRAGVANQRLMAYSGIASLIILLLGMWVIAGFVPPPGPNKSLEQIVALYTEHGVRIRFGLIVACAGVTLLGPWTVVIAIQMRRVEGQFAPLALLQAILGAVLIIEFYVPSVMWMAAAFRPELDPAFTYRLHDLASITFVSLPWSAALQAILLAMVILQDNHDERVFPRWLAYLSAWAAVSFLPGAFNCLAKTGIIAWNGVLAWWLGLSAFGIWIVAVSFCLLRYALPYRKSPSARPRP